MTTAQQLRQAGLPVAFVMVFPDDCHGEQGCQYTHSFSPYGWYGPYLVAWTREPTPEEHALASAVLTGASS
jgi:hypothetical protein